MSEQEMRYQLEKWLAQVTAERDRLRELIGNIRDCGVEHDDPRLRYVTVQIDRSLWEQVHE